MPSNIPVASASLPRLQSSKKYKAPEPPGATKQGSLASKLKVLPFCPSPGSVMHRSTVCPREGVSGKRTEFDSYIGKIVPKMSNARCLLSQTINWCINYPIKVSSYIIKVF